MSKKNNYSVRLFILIILCFWYSDLSASTADTTLTATITATITDIKSNNKTKPNEAGLEDEIIIKVKDAPEFNDEELSSQKVIFFFDGIPLNDVFPRKNTVNRNGSGELRFFIPHEDNAGKLWGDLLSTSEKGEFFKRNVCINVGLYNPANNQMSLVTDEYFFTLVLVRQIWFWTVVALLLFLLVVFIILAIKSDIIRDMGYNPSDGSRRPFSLARTQMAVWTFVIISAWLLLYVFQHTLNSITDSMAVLMGISSATGLGSVALEKDKNRLMSSKGFLKDILSDASGISFHRFQIFAWTIVMVVVFCRQVLFYYEMPQFNASLLVLMGISSGTYLGYKVTENPVKQVENTAETNPETKTD